MFSGVDAASTCVQEHVIMNTDTEFSDRLRPMHNTNTNVSEEHEKYTAKMDT